MINAIGDGKNVAESITRRAVEESKIGEGLFAKSVDPEELRTAKGRRQPGTLTPEIGFDERSGFKMVINTMDEATAQAEAARCLQCDEICSVCVSVCPNRANVEFQIKPVSFKIQQAVPGTDGAQITDLETGKITQKYQILNLGDCCNECGNCATFCPTSGAPYQDKPKFHLTSESFKTADYGYYFSAENRLEYKKDQKHAVLEIDDNGFIFENETFKAVLNKDYSAQQVEFKNGAQQAVSLLDAVHMAILSEATRELAPFKL